MPKEDPKNHPRFGQLRPAAAPRNRSAPRLRRLDGTVVDLNDIIEIASTAASSPAPSPLPMPPSRAGSEAPTESDASEAGSEEPEPEVIKLWEYMNIAGSDLGFGRQIMTRYWFVLRHFALANDGFQYKKNKDPTAYCVRIQERNLVVANHADAHLAGEREGQFRDYVDPLVEFLWSAKDFENLFKLMKRADKFRTEIHAGKHGLMDMSQREHVYTIYLLLSALGLDKRRPFSQGECQMMLRVLFEEGYPEVAGYGQGNFDVLGVDWKVFLGKLKVKQTNK